MGIGAVLFALMNVLARMASASTSWTSVAALRALIGAFVAFAFARARGASLAAVDRKILFWRSLFGTGAMMATFYALSSRTVPLGDTVTLLNLAPVFVAVLAPLLLRESTSGTVMVGIAIAIVGVVLVVHPSFVFGGQTTVLVASDGPSARVTAVVAIVAALLTAVAMMLLRRAGRSETPEAIAVHFSLFAALVTGLLSLLDLRLPTAAGAAYMIGAGVCAGVAQIAMTRAYALERAARVGGMSYLSVVASALLGAVQLGEVPTPLALVGMALVIAGGVVVTLRSGS